MKNKLIDYAKKYLASSLSVLFVNRKDKTPFGGSWKKLQKEAMSVSELEKASINLTKENGIALVCGTVSNNLFVIDIDNKKNTAEYILNEYITNEETAEIIEKYKIPIIETQNKGFHIVFKSETKVESSTKLAVGLDENNKKVTIVETRGEGSYAITFPTNGYKEFLNSLDNIPVISEKEMQVLLNFGKSFNEIIKENNIVNNNSVNELHNNERVGDIFNSDYNSLSYVKELLKKNGWTQVGKNYWRRPDKTKGISASLAYKNTNLFYVFTSSTQFENEKAYTPFAVKAILEHNGDFKACAKALIDDGIVEINKEIKPKIKKPKIDTMLFNRLPSLLKEIVNLFEDSIEKNNILLSSLTILSNVFTGVYGYYDSKKIHTNIYSFIVMPAASGKSIIRWSTKLVKSIESTYNNAYIQKKAEYEDLKLKKESDETIKLPPKPLLRSFFISADNSSSGFKQNLLDNKGIGMIMEEEADVLANTLKQDWGNISAELRKAYDYAPITLYRKTDRENIKIENPCLSILLAGTVKQVRRLLPDEEDGLFSRFIFIINTDYNQFKNPFNSVNNYNNIEKTFEMLDKRVFKLYNLKQRKIEFKLSEKQQDRIYQIFSNLQQEYIENDNKRFVPNIRRAGLIVFKLAMLLTILDSTPTDINSIIICNDNNFDVALELTLFYLENSKFVLSLLYKINLYKDDDNLLKVLPKKFTKKDYNSMLKQLNINIKTGEKKLEKLISLKLIKRIKHGFYQKN